MKQSLLPDLKNYVGHLADLMGLGDWEFSVSIADLHKEDPGTLAQIQAPDNNRTGDITIDRRWRRWDRAKLRDVVVHELVHAHLEHFCWGVNTMAGVIPFKVYAVYRSQLLGTNEMVADRIALSWAKSLPLIEEVKDVCS